MISQRRFQIIFKSWQAYRTFVELNLRLEILRSALDITSQYRFLGYSTKEDVMENLLVIDIQFSSMQVSEIREIVTYGWGNFLGQYSLRVQILEIVKCYSYFWTRSIHCFKEIHVCHINLTVHIKFVIKLITTSQKYGISVCLSRAVKV